MIQLGSGEKIPEWLDGHIKGAATPPRHGHRLVDYLEQVRVRILQTGIAIELTELTFRSIEAHEGVDTQQLRKGIFDGMRCRLLIRMPGG